MSEGDPTRVYEDEHDGTEAYDDGPGTTRAYDDAAGVTRSYGEAGRRTEAYNDTSSPPSRTETHDLGPGDTVELKGQRYTIDAIVSGDDATGEAVVYRIRDSQDTPLALKLYHEFRNARLEPRAETLERIQSIDDPDVLKLHDFGVGEDKYENRFCFEVAAFAEGGTLLSVEGNLNQKYTTDFLTEEIVTQLYEGLKTLHDQNVVHCDLKPRNVFYLDEAQLDLVIGDYGSAKTFEHDDEKRIRHTSVVKGTEFYLAPERYVFSEKNDYYSMGMILLRLMYPEVTRRSSQKRIFERQVASKPVWNFRSEYGRLNDLVAGLTLQDPNRRWGRDEVGRWMEGEQVAVAYRRESDASRGPAIKLSRDQHIRTEEDLVGYIDQAEEWYENLFEDEEGWRSLLFWIMETRGQSEKKVFEQMVRRYQPQGKTFVEEAVLRYFRPSRPVRVEMVPYDFWNSSESVSDLFTQFVEQLDDLWKITDLATLRCCLFQAEFSLRQLQEHDSERSQDAWAVLEQVAGVLEADLEADFSDYRAVLHEEATDESLLDLFYAFDEDRTFRDRQNESIAELRQVGLFFARERGSFDDQYLSLERRRFLQETDRGELANLGYEDFLFQLFTRHEENAIRFVDVEFGEPSIMQCTVSYRLERSLTSFFARKGVDRSLDRGGANAESVSITGTLLSRVSKQLTRATSAVASAHRFSESTLSEQAVNSFHNDLASRTSEHRREALGRMVTSKAFLLSLLALVVFSFVIAGSIRSNDSQTGSFSSRETSTEQSGTLFSVIITTERLNVREGPSTSYDVIATVEERDRYDVLETDGNWQRVRVRIDDGQERAGWIYSDYTRRASAQENIKQEDEAPNTEENAKEEDPKIVNPLKELAERRAERRREEQEEENETVPAEIVSLDAPTELTVGERGTFTATVNEGEATPPINSNWEFGDGTRDDGLVTTHAYDEPGTYTVRYRASNEGATDVTSARVTVEEKPPSSRSFRSGASATFSVQNYRFQVTVLQGRASPTYDGRTRLALEVRQKSMNYNGKWIQWDHILRESYLSVGNQRYEVKRAASDNLGRGNVSPGGARTGTVVFEVDRSLQELSRPTLYFAYYPYDNVRFARIPFTTVK